jgi:hypothetical protein
MWKQTHMLLVALTAMILTASASAEYTVDWYTIDGGGSSESAGGGFTLAGTIAQPDAGVMMTGTELTIESGFWPGIRGPGLGAGDCDGDGDVDLVDYACFAACMTGPGGGVASECLPFDLDSDNDVDLGDWGDFALFFTVP